MSKNYSVPFVERKYAQTNEETVLLNLVREFDIKDNFVLDIGAGDGWNLSNSRLLMDKGWDAFRIDGAYESHKDKLYKSFITRENIVGTLKEHDVPQHHGILTIDIDGNDLYILNEVLSAGFRPSIICFELNAARNPASFDVIQYDPTFKIVGDYYGASWGAFKHVLALHGYTTVHQIFNLNGFAVIDTLNPEANDSCPRKSQDHPHNPNGVWIDAREVFVI